MIRFAPMKKPMTEFWEAAFIDKQAMWGFTPERIKLIQDCYSQLKPGGTMVFVTISKEDPIFGKGTPLGTDRFERIQGVQIFFYDTDSVNREFGACGLVELSNIDESSTHANNQPPQKFLMVTCKK